MSPGPFWELYICFCSSSQPYYVSITIILVLKMRKARQGNFRQPATLSGRAEIRMHTLWFVLSITALQHLYDASGTMVLCLTSTVSAQPHTGATWQPLNRGFWSSPAECDGNPFSPTWATHKGFDKLWPMGNVNFDHWRWGMIILAQSQDGFHTTS